MSRSDSRPPPVDRSGWSADDLVAAFEADRTRLLRRRRWIQLGQILVFSALMGGALHVSGLFSTPLGDGALDRILHFLGRLTPDLQSDQLLASRSTPGSLAFWLYDLPNWLHLLAETVQIAVVATMIGAALALPLSFFASGNLTPAPWIHWVVRRTLELVRTMPDLITALILVAAFGVGPAAGVIALSLGTAASLAKLFAEANEAAEMRQLEALEAAGAGWWQKLRFGLLPQVLPNHASYTLLRLEVNVGGAVALGIVGAGGIGIELSRAITFTEFETYFALLLLIVALIFVIDLTSEAIRHRLIGLVKPA